MSGRRWAALLVKVSRLLFRVGVPGYARDRVADDFEDEFVESVVPDRGFVGAALWWAREVGSVLWWYALRGRSLVRAHREGRIHGPFEGSRVKNGGRAGIAMSSLFSDVRYASRGLARSPGFTIVAVLTLALGIGANTAIFSVANAVVFRPLPYHEPDRLVMIWKDLLNRDRLNFPSSNADYGDYLAAESFEGIAAVSSFNATVRIDGQAQRAQGGSVTANLFDVLGVRPVLGRTFTPEEGLPVDPTGDPDFVPPPRPIVLSHDYWMRVYGGDRDVLGRSVEIGTPNTIVGVLPAGFEILLREDGALPPDIQFWLPNRADFANAPRSGYGLRVIGRLRDGVTLEQAQAEMESIFARQRELFEVYAVTNTVPRLVPMHADLTAGVRPIMTALLGAVAFILLIACANVANLLLVRAAGRRQEISMRRALGAAGGRLVRQTLVESGVLAALGAVGGLALAHQMVRVLSALGPENLPRQETIAIDGGALAFTLVAAVVATALFGVVPALQTSRVDVVSALKGHGPALGSPAQRRLRKGVVVGEVALSVVLLVGAGLMVRSLRALQRVEPGYVTDSVLTFRLGIPNNSYPTPEERSGFKARILERFEALPGVVAAAGTSGAPLAGGYWNGPYGTEAEMRDGDQSDLTMAQYRQILPGYFEAFETDVVEGRDFDSVHESEPFVLVDEMIAEKYWPDGGAVGKRVFVKPGRFPDGIWMTVVGVVGHQRLQGLGDEGLPVIYFPDAFMNSASVLTYTIRTTVDPLGLVEPIRRTVAELDEGVWMDQVRTMDRYVSDARAPTRFAVVLIGGFGALALVLATVGLYGVLSYVVRQRTGEIGIRMTFGAQRSRILRAVVGEGVGLALGGIVIGLIAAAALTRVMASLLVGVTPTDPATFAGIAVVFAAVAGAACLKPALRATRVSPVTALRDG